MAKRSPRFWIVKYMWRERESPQDKWGPWSEWSLWDASDVTDNWDLVQVFGLEKAARQHGQFCSSRNTKGPFLPAPGEPWGLVEECRYCVIELMEKVKP